MTFQAGDQVRLKDHPTVVGTVIGKAGYTAVCVRFTFSSGSITGNAIRIDSLELVPFQLQIGDLAEYNFARCIVYVPAAFEGHIRKAWREDSVTGDFKLVYDRGE